MIRVAICDDMITELTRISKLISRYYEQKMVAFRCDAFPSAIELLHTIKSGVYDVLLLDVLMPGTNGIQAAHEIREFDRDIKIIFLTSSPEFAVESYSVDAYYYLLKPATEEKLFPILDKLFVEAQRKEEAFHVKTASGLFRVLYSKLEFVEVMNKKLYFHLSDGSIKDVCGTLTTYETELLCRQEFIKVHRSFIVNMDYIQEFGTKELIMDTKQIIPISRLLYGQVRESYMSHLFSEKEDL